jgi:hypothetical protein
MPEIADCAAIDDTAYKANGKSIHTSWGGGQEDIIRNDRQKIRRLGEGWNVQRGIFY